jgi:riboflavin synthase
MFTGLIEEVGSVIAVRAGRDNNQLRPQVASTRRPSVLQIAAPRIAEHATSGDSIAVNGCCLTVTSRQNHSLTFELLEETIARTSLKNLHSEDPVNLERPLRADGRLGGHFVQGHIDCASHILAFDKRGADFRLEIELPAGFDQCLAQKGSIAVDGISLTVAEILPKSFVVWITPYTKQHTNLDRTQAGSLVNLEFDILAKYVERMLRRPS